MFVQWRSAGRDSVKSTPVDVGEAERLTHDGTDLASTVAKLVFDANRLLVPEWSVLPEGRGPTLEILAPEEFAGAFRVSVSHRRRGGAIRIGTAAHRLIVPDEAERERSARLAESATAPEDVEKAYEILGNIYGHEIRGSLDEAEAGEIETLEALYANATLHGLGFPARSKTRGRIGFLATARLDDGRPWPDWEALHAFAQRHGVVPQAASRWAGEDVRVLVGFVPMSRIGEARAISDGLEDLADTDPKPAP